MEAAASALPAAVALAGTAASVASQFMNKSKAPSSSATKIEAAPTRDTAADGLAATQAEEAKRRSWQTESGSTQLTPVGGVASDLTGTRMLVSGR